MALAFEKNARRRVFHIFPLPEIITSRMSASWKPNEMHFSSHSDTRAMLVAGIDVGTSAFKLILLKNGNSLGSCFVPMLHGSEPASEQSHFESLLKEHELKISDVDLVVCSGLRQVRELRVDRYVPEAIALAHWAKTVTSEELTILNVGYQQITAIKAKAGRVLKSAASEKCASGTGVYLEIIGDLLGGHISEQAEGFINGADQVSIVNTCAVFVETEIISLLHRGIRADLIFRAALSSLASRLRVILSRVGVSRKLYLVGGYALNQAFVSAMQREFGEGVVVPFAPELVVASGCAAIAQHLVSKGVTV